MFFFHHSLMQFLLFWCFRTFKNIFAGVVNVFFWSAKLKSMYIQIQFLVFVQYAISNEISWLEWFYRYFVVLHFHTGIQIRVWWQCNCFCFFHSHGGGFLEWNLIPLMRRIIESCSTVLVNVWHLIEVALLCDCFFARFSAFVLFWLNWKKNCRI